MDKSGEYNNDNYDNQELEEYSSFYKDNDDNEDNDIHFDKLFGPKESLLSLNEDNENYNDDLYYCNNKSQENNINIIKDEKEKTKKATEIENYNTTLKTPAPVNNNNIDEQENKKKKSKKDNKQENKDFLNKKKGRKKIDMKLSVFISIKY